MRVLFASLPAAGHLFHLVPLAWALRAQGHEVLVASYDGAEIVADAGLHVSNIAPGLNMFEEAFVRGGTKRPDLLERVQASMGGDREALMTLYAFVNDTVADRMVALARDWRPDLVVYEYFSPVGQVVAAALGVPAVQFDFGFSFTPPLIAVMLEQMRDTFVRNGATEPPPEPLIVHNVPDSMLSEPRPGLAVRSVPYNGGAELPEWSSRRPERPRVVISFGTSIAAMSGLDRVKRTVEAARDVDADFVMAMGSTDLTELGELPANVRSVGWMPLHVLLAGAGGLVHHGGSSTTFTALHSGVPQLVLPNGSDCFINARTVAARGLGLTGEPEDIDTALLRRLIDDDKLRANAAEVRAEIDAMPAPATLVPEFERLARRE
ncbi:nucleotide disphospho-sugar-binding domain-containing protein [Actinophytocola oryzae]|uniref:UDP:flavonoid glycosyltransferase YjiC (YdhE family) n=1 Tax=Actinophytocola oryzae TaxID=502181 RepID=A0A4R7URT6_9PSEU|nr:nucleotide disphospho-sugar-binding domain-containing protein [Actinophytocola oryzae]TDV37792.1 UDP:flavonoid glycosyltransferase YjiC (YdhE family) [Actinophytocola oryzae]